MKSNCSMKHKLIDFSWIEFGFGAGFDWTSLCCHCIHQTEIQPLNGVWVNWLRCDRICIWRGFFYQVLLPMYCTDELTETFSQKEKSPASFLASLEYVYKLVSFKVLAAFRYDFFVYCFFFCFLRQRINLKVGNIHSRKPLFWNLMFFFYSRIMTFYIKWAISHLTRNVRLNVNKISVTG